jgi:hypothetical protein
VGVEILHEARRPRLDGGAQLAQQLELGRVEAQEGETLLQGR